MSDLVPTDQIEQTVGATRHPHQHIGRADSATQTVYVLHSQKCKDSGIDLRGCEWSRALDNGIDPADWQGYEDRAVVLTIVHSRLFPVTPSWLDECVLPPATDRGGVSCPACDHAPHGSLGFCPNMASDNDCSCTATYQGASDV